MSEIVISDASPDDAASPFARTSSAVGVSPSAYTLYAHFSASEGLMMNV